MTDDHLITNIRTVHYDHDILGIPGLMSDDGEVQLFVGDPAHRVRLPAPAGEIIQGIRIRQLVRAARVVNQIAAGVLSMQAALSGRMSGSPSSSAGSSSQA